MFTFAYSAPAFGRTKANAFLANLTIAIPRGCLLKVAGWSMVASIASLEPWFIGLIFFLFLLGASSTKDFSDMKGDAAAGCRTLPIRFGVAPAARMIAPFFVLPWLLMPLGAWIPDPRSPGRAILTGDPWLLTALGVVLALWGVYTVRLILADPHSLAESEKQDIIDLTVALEARQQEEENLDVLPRVRISDIPVHKAFPSPVTRTTDHLLIAPCEAGTNGIAYHQIISELPALSEAELSILPCYAQIVTDDPPTPLCLLK